MRAGKRGRGLLAGRIRSIRSWLPKRRQRRGNLKGARKFPFSLFLPDRGWTGLRSLKGLGRAGRKRTRNGRSAGRSHGNIARSEHSRELSFTASGRALRGKRLTQGRASRHGSRGILGLEDTREFALRSFRARRGPARQRGTRARGLKHSRELALRRRRGWGWRCRLRRGRRSLKQFCKRAGRRA